MLLRGTAYSLNREHLLHIHWTFLTTVRCLYVIISSFKGHEAVSHHHKVLNLSFTEQQLEPSHVSAIVKVCSWSFALTR